MGPCQSYAFVSTKQWEKGMRNKCPTLCIRHAWLATLICLLLVIQINGLFLSAHGCVHHISHGLHVQTPPTRTMTIFLVPHYTGLKQSFSPTGYNSTIDLQVDQQAHVGPIDNLKVMMEGGMSGSKRNTVARQQQQQRSGLVQVNLNSQSRLTHYTVSFMTVVYSDGFKS